jgi:BolA protein
MEHAATALAIRAALERELGASPVEVIDHSARHAGHAEATGGCNFEVVVVSERFAGLSRLAAQRLVFAALGELMRGPIHALSMTTLTPEQWRARGGD